MHGKAGASMLGEHMQRTHDTSTVMLTETGAATETQVEVLTEIKLGAQTAGRSGQVIRLG